MAYDTFTLNIRETTPDGKKPTHLLVKIYPLADDTGTRLKLIKATTDDVVITGHVEALATAEQLTAGLLPIVLPDPRDDANLNPSGFGFEVKVETNYFSHTTTFGPDEIAAQINTGVVELEDVTSAATAGFSASTDYATASDLASEADLRASGDAALDARVDALEAMPAAPVASVNGETGAVVLDAADVGADAAGAAASVAAAAATDATTKANAAQTGAQTYADTHAEAIGVAADLVAAHIAATDPHGDRAYTDTQIAALVNGAPGLLNTLGEIAAQLATDESAVGALTTAVNARLVAANNLSDVPDKPAARTNLGLGNVNNTSDAAKPVSTAQQTELNKKATTSLPSYITAPRANPYDPELNVYNFKPTNTRKLRASHGKALTGAIAEWLMIGDSLMAGSTTSGGAFAWNNTWPRFMRDRLATTLGGTGMVRALWDTDRWNYTGGWNSATNITNVYASTNGATAIMTPDIGGDRFTLRYYDQGDGGTFTISVNGASSGPGFTTVTQSGAAGWKNVTLSTPVLPGQTVVMTKVSGSFLQIAAAGTWTSTGGLLVHNIAQGSASAADVGNGYRYAWGLNSANASALWNVYAATTLSLSTPDVVFIGLGANDIDQNATPATVTAAITAARNHYAPSADVVLVLTQQLATAFVSAADWEAYAVALYDLADTLDCPLIDFRARVGNYATTQTNGLTVDASGHYLPHANADLGANAAKIIASGLPVGDLRAVNALSELPDKPTARTNLGLGTAATHAHGDYQLADADLATLAGVVTGDNDKLPQVKSGAIALRTPAQVKTDLALTAADVALGSVENAVPRGRLLGVSTPTISPGIVNTAAETTMLSLTVPAALVAAGDLLRFEAGWDYLNNSGGTLSFTIRIKLGATTVFTTSHSTGSTANRYKATLLGSITLASLSDQRWGGTLAGTANVTTPMDLIATARSFVGVAQSTEDLSSDKTLAITAQIGSASASADVRGYAMTLMRMR